MWKRQTELLPFIPGTKSSIFFSPGSIFHTNIRAAISAPTQTPARVGKG